MDRISPEPKLSTFPDASANDTNHINNNNNNNNNFAGGKKRKGNLTSLSPSPLFGRPSSPRQSEERIGHNYHIYKAKMVSDGKKNAKNHSPTTDDNSTSNINSNKRFAGATATGVAAGNNIPNATGGSNEGSGRLSKEPPNARLRQKHADIHQHSFHFHQHPPTLQPQQNIVFQNSSNGTSTNNTSPATNFAPLEHQSSSGGAPGPSTINTGGNANTTTTTTTTTARFKGKLPALPDQSDPLRRVLPKPSAASTITTKLSNASSISEDPNQSLSHNLMGKAISNNGNVTGNNSNTSGQGSSNVTLSSGVGSGSSSPSPPLKQWEFRVPQRKPVVESRLDVSTDACDEEQGNLKGNSNCLSRHPPPPPPQGPPPNLKFQRHSLSLPYQSSAPPPHVALKQPTGVLKSGKIRAGGGGGASVYSTLQRGNNNTNNSNNNPANGYSAMISAASGGGVNDIFIAGHQRVGMMLADDPNAATAHTLLVLEGAVARERRLRDELAQARRQVTAGFRSVVKNYLAAYPLPNTTSLSGTSSLPPVFGPPRGANAVTTTNRGGAPSFALSVPMLKCSVVTNTLVTTIQSYLRFKSSAMVTAGRVRALVDSAPLLGTAAAPPARDLHTAAAQHDDASTPDTAVDFDPEGSGRLDSATLAKLKQLYFAYYDCETYVIHPDEEGSSPNAKPLLASSTLVPAVSGKDSTINNNRSDVKNVIEEANVLVEQQYGNTMGYDANGGGGGGKESSWSGAAPPAAVLDIVEGQSLLFDEEREWKQIYSDDEDEEEDR